MIVEIVLLLVVALLTYQYFGKNSRQKNFPPGPLNYPIVGSIPALRAKTPPQETIFNLSKKYGPVMGLSLGPIAQVITVNGYEAVKHVLASEDFAFRPDGILKARSFNKRLGVLFSDGPLWREQRRFSLRHLRDFGFGKKSMEGLIHEEISTFVENLNKRIGSASDMIGEGIEFKDLFPVSVINILWAIMAGVRYDHDNENFQSLMHCVNEFFRNGSPTGGILVLPILRFVPIVNAPFKRQIASSVVLQNFIRNTIEEHKSTYQEDNMRDFVDVFLREMKMQENNPDTSFTEEQLIVMCMDLFMAGTETTSNSLGFIFLYLMQYPEVQEKMRQEIFTVIGKDQLPSLDDLPKLHYVQAVTWEVLRMANLVPFTIPHCTSDKEVELFGYTVPKNGKLLVNLYSVMMEDSWGDPKVFRPERFIKDGFCVKDERLLLFGYGPRVCLGEPLAKNTSFLFLTTLVQNFRFSLPENHQNPSMEHLQGFTSSPRPYKVSVIGV